MKQKKLKLTTKISMVIFALMTIISPILFIIGALSIDSPNTTAPDIMCIIGLVWFAIVIYIDRKNR
jgi:EamA domain-containing membrane protein RarD